MTLWSYIVVFVEVQHVIVDTPLSNFPFRRHLTKILVAGLSLVLKVSLPGALQLVLIFVGRGDLRKTQPVQVVHNRGEWDATPKFGFGPMQEVLGNWEFDLGFVGHR